MIKEFIKEYHKLKEDYEQHLYDKALDDDAEWFLDELEKIVDKYEKELIAIELKEMYSQKVKFDPAVEDAIKDMEEEEAAFPPD